MSNLHTNVRSNATCNLPGGSCGTCMSDSDCSPPYTNYPNAFCQKSVTGGYGKCTMRATQQGTLTYNPLAPMTQQILVQDIVQVHLPAGKRESYRTINTGVHQSKYNLF